MDKSKKFTLLIAAGGTGGHIFPALAVAKEIIALGNNVVWLGTKKGLEAKIIPAEGIPLNYIWIWGMGGKSTLTKIAGVFKIVVAILQSILIIYKLKPNVVLGMGGFVAGPVGIAAWLLRIPLVIHEQNAIAGRTNKILLKFATRILQGFPHSFLGYKKAVFTGNPVRKEITKIVKHNIDLPSLRILVLGGSRGAKILNTIVPQAVNNCNFVHNISVWHQTGQDIIVTPYKGLQQTKIEAFITDMAAAYSFADLIICRAGALTIAELAAIGLASILVPFPQAIDDHQSVNAKYLSDNKAAILLPQTQLSAEYLTNILTDLYNHPEKIQAMANNSKALAMPSALNDVVSCCLDFKQLE